MLLQYSFSHHFRSSTLPSSRNCASTRLLDLGEEEAIDEMSSMSGYESLEAVNILSEPPIIRGLSEPPILRGPIHKVNFRVTVKIGIF